MSTYEEAVLALINQPNVAFYWEAAGFAAFVKGSNRCDFMSIPSFTIKTPHTFYIQTHSPYKEILNYQ